MQDQTMTVYTMQQAAEMIGISRRWLPSILERATLFRGFIVRNKDGRLIGLTRTAINEIKDHQIKTAKDARYKQWKTG
jgi:hypothetical protein